MCSSDLTSDAVTELAQLRSNISALQKEEKELTKDLKDKMQEEKLSEYCPKDSPYKLCCDESDRTSVSWKDEWTKLAKKQFGKLYKKTMEKIQDDSKVPIVTLRVEPNENYKEKE